MTSRELLTELIASTAQDKKLVEEIRVKLAEAGIDVTTSARAAFACLELAVESFRGHGVAPCTLAPILHFKAHGYTSDRVLKMLMLVQEEDDARNELKPATVN